MCVKHFTQCSGTTFMIISLASIDSLLLSHFRNFLSAVRHVLSGLIEKIILSLEESIRDSYVAGYHRNDIIVCQ